MTKAEKKIAFDNAIEDFRKYQFSKIAFEELTVFAEDAPTELLPELQKEIAAFEASRDRHWYRYYGLELFLRSTALDVIGQINKAIEPTYEAAYKNWEISGCRKYWLERIDID